MERERWMDGCYLFFALFPVTVRLQKLHTHAKKKKRKKKKRQHKSCSVEYVKDEQGGW